MADYAVKLVVEKLGAAIIEEGTLLYGIKEDLEYIKNELATMNAFLEEADDTPENAKIRREWIKQVRESAYDAEDCIDEFQRRLTRPPAHGRGFRRRLCVGVRAFRSLTARHSIATEIRRIKANVNEACIRAQKFGFLSTSSSNSAPGTVGSYGGNLSLHPFRLNALFIQEGELVGIDKPKNQLLDLLLGASKYQRSVFAVVGCGGLGKTTLVKRIFESQRLMDGLHFHCRAWITISESFQMMGFLKKLYEELFPNDSDSRMSEEKLIEKIRNYLQDKRYVLVFDDLWTIDAWESIKLVLPDDRSGSKIMVTTRDETVAHACCAPSHEHVYKLQPLSLEDSWDLFCRKVFNASCPDHLKDPTRLLLKKCGGLPLVVMTIGGVLANKPTRNIDDWNYLLDHLGSGLENNPSLEGMMQIMALSYDALPYHLKRCFLYLSIFPEDYEINSKRLQRLWIAEGMVRRHRDMTPEEVAQVYFNEFVSRSMLQPSKISSRGAVKGCRLHDIMLEFAISKSTEENLVALHKQQTTPMLQGVTRRMSLQYQYRSEVENIRADHLRSMFVFAVEGSHGLFLHGFSLLRVLDLNHVPGLTDDCIHYISKLYHLKYLDLRGVEACRIPDSFRELRNLEMLDVRGMFTLQRHGLIPDQVLVKLKKLRYLKADFLLAQPGFGGLRDLQVLEGVQIADYRSMAQELKNLNQLRKLGVPSLHPKDVMGFCAFISELSSSLRSLKVDFHNCEDSIVHQLDSLALPPLSLKSLTLSRYVGKLPGWLTSLTNVSKIVLIGEEISHVDNIRALQQLPNLVTLKLRGDEACQGLHFAGAGFPSLKSLTLEHLQSLKSLAFADGSMPRLEVFCVCECHSLCQVSEFVPENLPSLKEVVIVPPNSNTPMARAVSRAVAAHTNNPRFSERFFGLE